MPEKPVTLPLVTSVGVFFRDNPALTGAATPSTLTAQLDTLNGQIYFLQLTEKAAIGLLVGLSTWQPIQDYLSKQESSEPPKLQ